MLKIYFLLRNFAQTVVENCPADAQLSSGEVSELCGTALPKVYADRDAATTVLQITFGIVGALAVFFIILGGLKMITSQGDPQGISQARKMIIYAAIGLAVAVSAEVIVTWVLGQL